MKSLSLKVMTLLMAALVLSASGCFNKMSSPEGTVKSYLKALDHNGFKKMMSYMDPAMFETTDAADKQVTFYFAQFMKFLEIDVSNVKTTLVSDKLGEVWNGDKWHSVKNENATVEVNYKFNGENFQETVTLVLLDNKWYLEELLWLNLYADSLDS